MQTYEIENVNILLERDNSFTPVSLSFKFSVDFDAIVPETDEEALQYHRSISKVTKFLQGINNAYVVETNYPETELFVTGRINNISIEVPEGANKIPIIGLILHHKVSALLNSYDLVNFNMGFMLNDANNSNIKTTLDYNPETVTGSKLQFILNGFEEVWEEEMQNDVEELEGNDIPTDSDLIPWWHRNDGQVRDFINMDVDSFENLHDGANSIRILTIDIEDEFDIIADEYDNIDVEDDEPTEPKPSPDDDGYFKI